eukprot:2207071-Alexandrium_andersonii.AAC.1
MGAARPGSRAWRPHCPRLPTATGGTTRAAIRRRLACPRRARGCSATPRPLAPPPSRSARSRRRTAR